MEIIYEYFESTTDKKNIYEGETFFSNIVFAPNGFLEISFFTIRCASARIILVCVRMADRSKIIKEHILAIK